MKRGKKYVEAAKNIDRQTLYEAADAISLVKKNATAKFDETIEAHIRTGCDGRHAEQQIRGAVVLPHGTGKTVRVLVFAKGAKADEALAAGADFVGGEELIPKIQNDNWFEFDVVVATPDMMGVVGRLGRVLGPKGLMPNPKAGTVTSIVTVPALGFGINPLGPSTRPRRPTTPIISGVATTTSNSNQLSFWILGISSSPPTKSAPAARASSALAPLANTNTLYSLTCSVWKNNSSSDLLLSVTSITTCSDMCFDCLVEL